MQVPMIHLNGTSRSEIELQLTQAAQALTRAIEALQAASPNGRDYYPMGPDAITQAMDEHQSRIKRVQSVYDEIEGIFLALGS